VGVLARAVVDADLIAPLKHGLLAPVEPDAGLERGPLLLSLGACAGRGGGTEEE
jgi:hypothetical protein